ncbi:MAG: hypothetical protein IAE63_06790 [Alphaproteobacteria bacterium]|nr:hypothetical protein [Alphaproteobacteria bacterium]
MADTTDVDICNYSAVLMGVEQIASLDEESHIAAAFAVVYPKKRDAALAKFNWRVGIKKRLLARIDDAPLNEWAYIHALPSDAVNAPLAVFGDGSQFPSASGWEIYDGKIYSNFETIIVDYEASIDESMFPPLLVEFLAHDVAASLCIPLTESADRAQELRIAAYGPANLDGNGGLFAQAKRAVAQSQGTKSLFQNGDPLTSQRY